MENHLSVMGVDRWTLRSNAAPVLPACYVYELLYQGRCVGLLFAASPAEDSAVVQLLGKIIAALKCQQRGQWYVMQPDCSDFNDLRFVITLGEGFEIVDGVKSIQSYSPQRLIVEPTLKVETWKSLQTVFTLLPGFPPTRE